MRLHETREAVRERYAAAATKATDDGGCCGSSSGCGSSTLEAHEVETFGAALYGEDAAGAPAAAVAA